MHDHTSVSMETISTVSVFVMILMLVGSLVAYTMISLSCRWKYDSKGLSASGTCAS